MKEPLIRDIPSIRDTLTQAKSLAAVRKAWPVLRPLLRLVGVDPEKLEEPLTRPADLAVEMDRMAQVPDRFNSAFAVRGWILYGRMNLEVATRALEKAESGDMAGAEAELVDYFNPEHVGRELQSMKAVVAFRPRIRLAKLALRDYAERRFHASIPVILALIDGLVSELDEQRRGFFANGADLSAWDSIAAHSRGLGTLSNIFKKGRRKTNTDPIEIPYRHGILHGMDLAYDNRLVAAKVWAALFAVQEWAVKVERGELKPPPPDPPLTLSGLIEQLTQLDDDKRSLAEWRPRVIRVGVDLPAQPAAEVLEEGSPERALVKFLGLWQLKNFGWMASRVGIRFGPMGAIRPAEVRAVYTDRTLQSFKLVSIKDQAAAVTEIEATVVYEELGAVVEKNRCFRMVLIDQEGSSVIRGKPGGRWMIANWEM
jgi:hypothetical protein